MSTTLATGQLHFQFDEINPLVLHAGVHVGDLTPVARALSAWPGLFLFHLAVAVNAARGVRKSGQARHGDLLLAVPAAAVADAKRALLPTRQGLFDLAELAGVQFGQLGRHLMAICVERGIGTVAGGIRAMEITQS